MLAFACAFTMFAGAASFTDEADISENNRDAVELLTTLKIIKGYEDGSFDPEGTVDRAEMAKMIYTIRNGGNDDASAHVGNTTSFTDISGHWAEGYIKYLQNTGIVAGKSATQFAPDAQVTTAEAMKMALALAGYDEVNAGLTGIDWQKNTLTYATTIGLTDDVNSAMSAGCSRQDAAQILANVLEANAVRYSAIVENFVNDSKTGLSYGGDPITVGYKWMDLTIYVGRMVSSGELNIAGAKDAGKDRFSVVVDTVNGVDATDWVWDNGGEWVARTRTLTLKDSQDHTDLVGQEVKVLTGDKFDEVYGVYATGTSNVVETTMDQIDFDDDGLKVDGVVYDCVKNNTADTAVYADNKDAQTVNVVFSAGGDAQKVADRVKMIDWDDDGDYETIIVKTVSVAEVTSVSSSSISLSTVGGRDTTLLRNNRSLDFDDNTIYEDVARNDYAVVTMNLYDGNWIVEKATEVSGTVNGKVDNERRVRIDGEWYTLANTRHDGDNDDKYDVRTIDGSRTTFENGDAVTLYTVGSIAYYAESTRGNDANRAVLMVYDTYMNGSSWNGTPQAKVILADGTKETVDIDTINGAAPTGNANGPVTNLTVGALYYYEINNDGEYAFTDPTPNNTGYDAVVDWDDGINNKSVNNISIADEAVIFALINGDDAEVYTGKTVKDATKNSTTWGATRNGVYMTDDENGFNYVRMMNIAIDDELNTTTDYGYMISDAVRTRENGVWYMEYEFWNGTENVSVREETSTDRRDIHKGDIISFAYASGEGMIRDVKKNDDVVFAAMTGANSSSVQLLSGVKGPVTADVDGDTIIFYVDSNASNEENIGQTGLSGFDYRVGLNEQGQYPVNVAYVLDNDGDVKLLVIDVDNQMSGKGTVAPNADGVKVIKAADYTNAQLINEINDAEGNGKIVVTGSATIDGTINPTVPVEFENAVTLANGAVLNGDITAPSVTLSGNATLNGTLTITGNETNSGLDNLTGSNGAKIVLNNAYTAGTDEFFAGTAGSATYITNVPEGTYTWSATAGGTNKPGWLTAKTNEQIETTYANLSSALALSDNVVVTDAATIASTDPIMTAANIAGKTITFKSNVNVNDSLTVPENTTLNVEGNLAIDGGDTLTVNGTVNVDGTLTNNAGTLDGKGVVNAKAVAAGQFVAPAAGATLTLKLGTEATSIASGAWNIGGYTGANVNAPAGTYTAASGVWTLTTEATEINVTVAISNANLQALFSKTNSVVLTATPSEKVTIPAGKVLTIEGNALIQNGVTVAGTLILNKDTNWNLNNITGMLGGKVSFTENLQTDPSSYDHFWYGVGTPASSYLSLAGETYTFTANADGIGGAGFLAQP